MNDRLLRVTVILSVFALIGMAGAGSAAAQDFNVTELDAPQVAPFDDTVDVTVTIGNEGTASGTANVTFAANETSPIGPDSTVFGPNVTTPSIPDGDTFTTTLTLNTNTSYPGLTSNDTVDEIVHGVVVNDTSTTPETIDNITEAPFTVGTDNLDGAVVVENKDTNGFALEDANVSLFLGSANPSNLIAANVTADGGPDGNRIRFTRAGNNPTKPESTVQLAIGPDRNNPIEYVVRSTKEPNFQASVRSGEIHEDNVEATLEPELQRIARPERFEIVQSSESALADGEDFINFNVSIIGNIDGERLTNEPFTVFHNGGETVNDSIESGTTLQTDGNGFVEFDVTANRSQSVTFEFVADNDESVTETRVKDFVLQGEGTVFGDVWNAANPNLRALEDARIWAVRKDRVTAQGVRVPPEAARGNFTGNPGFAVVDAFNTSGQTSFFRLRKTESPDEWTPEEDEILDVTQDYRIDNNGQNENLSISRVRELNTSDSRVGSGWAVRANVDFPKTLNATGDFNATGMFVTPLEPGYYYVEQSPNAWNASDERFIDNSNPAAEDFEPYATGGLSQFAASGPVAPTINKSNAPLRRNGNLTFERAQEFSQFSGQQLTDLTDPRGEYLLDDMFTDFQAGVDYTIFANKADFEIEFVDAFVTESGAFFENGEDENFALRPIEEDRRVNITNLAALPSIEDAPNASEADDPSAYDEFAFDNQTDRFSQVVPRDGRTIDVLQVNTQTESGAPSNETIKLSVPALELPGTQPSSDLNFTGEFVAVAGGTEVSNDPVAPTVTINTGPDGQAIVWLQSDLDGETLEPVNVENFDTGGQVCGVETDGGFVINELFSGVVAQSTTDAGAIDATCKDFRGTVVFQTAELSGVVTEQNNNPIESRVWTREIDIAGSIPVNNPTSGFEFVNQRIEVTRTGSDSYTVEHLVDNVTTGIPPIFQNERTLGIETGVSTSELNRYEGFATTNFPQIAVGSQGANGFTLLGDTDDITDPGVEETTYTLSDVPAQSPTAPITDITTKGIEKTTFTFTGQSVATGVQIDRTSTANIEISTPLGVQFNVTDVDAPETVTQGDTFAVDADIFNDGTGSATRTVSYELVNEAGTVVRSQSQTIVLGGDSSTTVTFSVDSMGLPPENYTSTVTTPDDPAGESSVTEIVSPTPASFQLSNLDPEEATVTEGDDPVDISADVDNVGGAQGTQALELTVENSSGVQFSDTISGVSVDAGDSTTVTFTDVPAGDLAPGEYDHIVSSDNDTIEGNLTVESGNGGAPLFTDPLPAFSGSGAPPTNTQEIDPNLFEDVDGDGDGLETDEAVQLWSDVVQNPGDYSFLTQDQVDALDWDGDDSFTAADAVNLWSEKVQESS